VKWRVLRLLLGGASLVYLSAVAADGAAAAGPVRAALLPIAVHSADDGSRYLSDGLAEMISARLEQSGGVTVVRVSGAAVGTSEVEKALEAGRSAGADFVVFGAFTQFGAGASLDVQCAKVGGEEGASPRRIFVQSGTLGEIIPKLDELAEKIARFMATGEASGPVSASAPSVPSSELDEIRRRLDVLEREVHSRPAATPRASSSGSGTPSNPGLPGAGLTR
jgi:TolB-like protein